MILSKRNISIFLFTGVIFFGIGTFLYSNELIQWGGYTFNPFLGAGVIFFGLGLVKPILKIMGF